MYIDQPMQRPGKVCIFPRYASVCDGSADIVLGDKPEAWRVCAKLCQFRRVAYHQATSFGALDGASDDAGNDIIDKYRVVIHPGREDQDD
ncbi:hypothetical protein ABIC16_002336 [Sphingomonas sp. PvP055]